MSLKPSNTYLLKTRKSSPETPQTCDQSLIIWDEKAFKLFSFYYPDIKQEKKHLLDSKELSPSPSTPLKPGNINFPLLSRHWVYRYVRDQKQSGLFSVELPLPEGNISSSNLIRLAEFLTPLGEDNIRMSVHRNFFLRNIPGEQLLPLQGLLKDISNQNEEKEDISPITLNGHNILEKLRKTGAREYREESMTH